MIRMGFRFRKSIKIAPGISLNIGKKGISASIGPRGAKITVGTRGTRATVGLPGTGLSFTATGKQLSKSIRPKSAASNFLKECPYCGRRMRKRWDECPQCGRELPQPDLPTQQQQPVITEEFEPDITISNEPEEMIVQESLPEPVIPPPSLDPHLDNDYDDFYLNLELFNSNKLKASGYEYAKKLFSLFYQLAISRQNEYFLKEQFNSAWMGCLVLTAIITYDLKILKMVPPVLIELYSQKVPEKHELMQLSYNSIRLAENLKDYFFSLPVTKKQTKAALIQAIGDIMPYPEEVFTLLLEHKILNKDLLSGIWGDKRYHKSTYNFLSKQKINSIRYKIGNILSK